MKLYRSILSLAVLFVLIVITSCSSTSLEPDKSCPGATVTPACNTESFYTVLADEHLQEDHKIAILQALNEWAEKTNNTFTYKLSFVDMSKEPQDTSAPHTIKIYVKDPGPGYLGWTSWSSDNHSAYTFVEPSIDGELFRRIMLHELGHSFELSFNGDIHYQGPYASVMHPSIGDDSLHLCCPELQAFCHNYGCQVECSNVPKSSPQAKVEWVEIRELPSK